MALKEGYIQIFVSGNDSFIMNSHGFVFNKLSEMNHQIKEYGDEHFEGMIEGPAVFKPVYHDCVVTAEGRIAIPDYWVFEQDEYCKEKTKKVKKELDMYEQQEGDCT